MLFVCDVWKEVGGANRDRTDDLMLAKHALSQLSYGPAVALREPARRALGPAKAEARRAKDGGPG